MRGLIQEFAESTRGLIYLITAIGIVVGGVIAFEYGMRHVALWAPRAALGIGALVLVIGVAAALRSKPWR